MQRGMQIRLHNGLRRIGGRARSQGSVTKHQSSMQRSMQPPQQRQTFPSTWIPTDFCVHRCPSSFPSPQLSGSQGMLWQQWVICRRIEPWQEACCTALETAGWQWSRSQELSRAWLLPVKTKAREEREKHCWAEEGRGQSRLDLECYI